MYFKKNDNGPENEQYLKQDGKTSTMVMIIDDYCCEIQTVKRDTFYTDKYVVEEFTTCTESDFQIGLKKAISILKMQLL